MRSMVAVDIPDELRKQFDSMEQQAYSYLIVGDFRRAEQTYESQYNILRSKEEKLPDGERYHKGGPLHNWGISLLYQNKVIEGLQKIILAYIEDVLDYGYEKSKEFPAYKTLDGIPQVKKEILHQIGELAEKGRQEGKVPREPKNILVELHQMIENPSEVTLKPRTISLAVEAENIPNIVQQLEMIATRDKRVFIGGNYQNIVLLRHVKDIVEDINGFRGIMPIDLNEASLPENHIHDRCMEYLKGCSHAIFEISINDGYLMEIEQTINLNDMKILLLYQVPSAQTGEERYTAMLKKFEDKIKIYSNLTELVIKISQFLSS